MAERRLFLTRKVTSKKEAIAIGLSEARKAGAPVPRKKKAWQRAGRTAMRPP